MCRYSQRSWQKSASNVFKGEMFPTTASRHLWRGRKSTLVDLLLLQPGFGIFETLLKFGDLILD